MLTSRSVHTFIKEFHKEFKASKDLSRSLRDVTWLWRTRKVFLYTAIESRKGTLRRAFFISKLIILDSTLFSYIPILFMVTLVPFICLPYFILFLSSFFFLHLKATTYFFSFCYTRVPYHQYFFLFQNKPLSPTSIMTYIQLKRSSHG